MNTFELVSRPVVEAATRRTYRARLAGAALGDLLLKPLCLMWALSHINGAVPAIPALGLTTCWWVCLAAGCLRSGLTYVSNVREADPS